MKKQDDFFFHVGLDKEALYAENFSSEGSFNLSPFKMRDKDQEISFRNLQYEKKEEEDSLKSPEGNQVKSVSSMDKGSYELYIPPGVANQEFQDSPKFKGRISHPIFSPLILSSSIASIPEMFKTENKALEEQEPLETFRKIQKENRRSKETADSSQPFEEKGQVNSEMESIKEEESSKSPKETPQTQHTFLNKKTNPVDTRKGSLILSFWEPAGNEMLRKKHENETYKGKNEKNKKDNEGIKEFSPFVEEEQEKPEKLRFIRELPSQNVSKENEANEKKRDFSKEDGLSLFKEQLKASLAEKNNSKSPPKKESTHSF